MHNTNTPHHNHHTRAASQPARWSKEDIRAARMVAIAPLLEKRGMHLIENGGGNYSIREHPGLIIKDSYWRLPERNTGGNAIDLLTQVLRLNFNDAMLELSQTRDALESGAGPKPS
jgi:hypothetical protein